MKNSKFISCVSSKNFRYRAWDLLYNTLSWPSDQVSDKNVKTFSEHYVDERKKRGDKQITTEKLLAELQVHAPYVILEHMIYSISFGFGTDDYMASLRKRYKREAQKLNRTILYSFSPSLVASALLTLITIIL